MAKSEKNEEWIECRAIIEVLGKPKEHVEETIRSFVEKIKQDPEIKVTSEEYEPAQPQQSLFSTFVELEFSVAGFENLITFCFDYMPSSIEIINPEQITVPQRELSNLLNDLQAKLHRLDMLVKTREAELSAMKKNSTTLLKNVLKLSLKTGGKNLQQLALYSGIDEKQLLPFLGIFIEQGMVKKEGNIYRLTDSTEQ